MNVHTGPGVRLLRDALRGGGRPLLGIAVWSFVEAAPALASGWIIAEAIDHGFLAGRLRVGLLWLAALAALYAVRAFAGRALFGPYAALIEPMRDRLVRAVVTAALRDGVRYPVAFGDGVDTVSVARVTQQVELVRALVGGLIRTVRPIAVTVIAALAGLVTLAPALLVLVLPPLVAAAVAYPATVRALARRNRAAMFADERVAGAAGRVLSGVRDVTALGARDSAAAEVVTAVRAHARASVATARLASIRVALDVLGGYLPVTLVLLAGPWLMDHRSATAGQLVGAITYLTAHLIPALRMLTGDVSDYFTQLGVVLDHLADVTNDPAPPSDRPSDRPAPAVPPTGGALRLRGVSFRYGRAVEPVVRDLDLDVPAGGHLAIVGASGIGKSTLAGLIAGVDRPDHGTVRVDGVDPADYPASRRHRAVAYLPQQAYVLAGSVRENLRYLCGEATDPDLRTAVEAVGMGPLLDRLGGLDAVIENPGDDLSAGERQLIALTRAHVSPASLVVLDEASCHLDHTAERRAEHAFVARSGTVIVIAHRIGSALRADEVLFLHEHGHVIGTPDELARSCPAFAMAVEAAGVTGSAQFSRQEAVSQR